MPTKVRVTLYRPAWIKTTFEVEVTEDNKKKLIFDPDLEGLTYHDTYDPYVFCPDDAEWVLTEDDWPDQHGAGDGGCIVEDITDEVKDA